MNQSITSALHTETTLLGVGGRRSLVAYWPMAWGDASVSGMLCAVFVAFRLATWSDRLYLHPKS